MSTKQPAKNRSYTSSFKPEKVWFTSDTHFHHRQIIRLSHRPFGSVDEMNRELIKKWNETIPKDGIVFHLGDFCMGSYQQWDNILSQLNGRIYLILGNHDMQYFMSRFKNRIERVTQQMTIHVGDQIIILNHNPFLCYGGESKNVWQLFGHVHSGPLSIEGFDLPRLKMLFPRQYDVGVDNNCFRPVSFAEVKAKIKAQVEAARQLPELSII